MSKSSEQNSGSKKSGSFSGGDRSIEEEAYALAEKRGFEPGYELDDWLAAEQLIQAR